MHGYLARSIVPSIVKRLGDYPSVAVLGARQVGKSTIAEIISTTNPKAIYLDLERPSDLNKLRDPEAFFDHFSDRLICLDEIQRAPEIFPVMRGVIDRSKRNGQFLVLGSASRDLIRQSSESLAGRLSYIEVEPFTQREIDPAIWRKHWLLGGYPRSFLANDEEASFQWREDYIQSYLERDIPQLGFRIPANTLGRLWRMLAHSHGQLLNSSKLAESMGVSSNTIRKYVDLLEQTFVVRTLQPYGENTKKRLVKSPKVYIRDSGLLHALLEIETMEDLFSHPNYGSSFEGYVIENILMRLPRWHAYFYRTSHGAEIDLVLRRGRKTIALEIKSATSPKVAKGFWNAIADVAATEAWVIAPVDAEYSLGDGVKATSLSLFLNSGN